MIDVKLFKSNLSGHTNANCSCDLTSDHRRKRSRNVDPPIIENFIGASPSLGEGLQCITSSNEKVDDIDELCFSYFASSNALFSVDVFILRCN